MTKEDEDYAALKARSQKEDDALINDLLNTKANTGQYLSRANFEVIGDALLRLKFVKDIDRLQREIPILVNIGKRGTPYVVARKANTLGGNFEVVVDINTILNIWNSEEVKQRKGRFIDTAYKIVSDQRKDLLKQWNYFNPYGYSAEIANRIITFFYENNIYPLMTTEDAEYEFEFKELDKDEVTLNGSVKAIFPVIQDVHPDENIQHVLRYGYTPNYKGKPCFVVMSDDGENIKFNPIKRFGVKQDFANKEEFVSLSIERWLNTWHKENNLIKFKLSKPRKGSKKAEAD